MGQFKLHRQHSCASKHRTYVAMGKCAWKRAAWVDGDGPYAVLAHCRELTVRLHQTPEAAEEAKDAIDRTACGGRCSKQHELVQMVLP